MLKDPRISHFRFSTCVLVGGVAGLLFSASSFAVQTMLPNLFPGDRYEKMIQRSPFAVATAVVAIKADEPNFAQNLYVAGLAKLRFEDGTEKDQVTIKTRGDLNSGFSLIGGEQKDGITLVGVEWSDNAKESKVTIKKGVEFATVKPDQQSAMTSPPGAGMAMPRPGMPVPPRMPIPVNNGAPGVPVNNFNGGRNGQPGLQQKNAARIIQSPIPRPSTVPFPNAPQGAVNPAMAPGADGQDVRRRVRQINSKP